MSNEIEGHFDVVVLGSGDEGILGPGMVFGFLAGRKHSLPSNRLEFNKGWGWAWTNTRDFQKRPDDSGEDAQKQYPQPALPLSKPPLPRASAGLSEQLRTLL